MQIRPILSTLRRHKLTAMLLVLQVAFTCAIVTNAVFLIVRRVQQVSVPSGLGEDSLSIISLHDLDVGNNPLALHQGDLAALRRLPGVESAAIVNNVPFSGDEDSSPACSMADAMQALMRAGSADIPGCGEATVYAGGPETLRTLGLKLVAGHDFRASDYVPGKHGEPAGESAIPPPGVIITEALAKRLYPTDPMHGVGRGLYAGMSGLLHGKSMPIVGVVEQLHRGQIGNPATSGFAMLLPVEPNAGRVTFALRSRPSDSARVIAEALAVLRKLKPDRDIAASDGKTYAQIRGAYFSRDTTMIDLLVAATLGLLFVTALGIGGLASFWVGQRTRTIGIRRALGATRGQILHYFQTENFLIVTGGVVLGVALTVGLNLLLMTHYEVPRLPPWYLPVGAAALWLLGQLAVLSPALRASRVPPVVATRSV